MESGTEGKDQSIDRGQVKFADLKFPIPNSRVLPTIADFHRCVCLYAIFDYFYVGVSSCVCETVCVNVRLCVCVFGRRVLALRLPEKFFVLLAAVVIETFEVFAKMLV